MSEEICGQLDQTEEYRCGRTPGHSGVHRYVDVDDTTVRYEWAEGQKALKAGKPGALQCLRCEDPITDPDMAWPEQIVFARPTRLRKIDSSSSGSGIARHPTGRVLCNRCATDIQHAGQPLDKPQGAQERLL